MPYSTKRYISILAAISIIPGCSETPQPPKDVLPNRLLTITLGEAVPKQHSNLNGDTLRYQEGSIEIMDSVGQTEYDPNVYFNTGVATIDLPVTDSSIIGFSKIHKHRIKLYHGKVISYEVSATKYPTVNMSERTLLENFKVKFGNPQHEESKRIANPALWEYQMKQSTQPKEKQKKQRSYVQISDVRPSDSVTVSEASWRDDVKVLKVKESPGDNVDISFILLGWEDVETSKRIEANEYFDSIRNKQLQRNF